MAQVAATNYACLRLQCLATVSYNALLRHLWGPGRVPYSALLRYPAMRCYGIYGVLVGYLATISYNALLRYPTVSCYAILQCLATISCSPLLRYPAMRCYDILQCIATDSYSLLLRNPTVHCYDILQSLATVSYSAFPRYLRGLDLYVTS